MAARVLVFRRALGRLLELDPRDAGPDAAAVNEDVLTVLLALDAASCERMLRDCFGSCAEGLDCLGGDVRTCAAACPD